MPAAAIFYVYEHWRPDKDLCFWVGKGNGDRAYRFRRNFHYDNVVKKLARLGMCVEVRMVASGMEEYAALALERERIAFWRGAGVILTNYTDGGEGISGFRHSVETRAKLSALVKGTKKGPPSVETRKKIAAAQLGKKRGPNPDHSKRMRGHTLSSGHRAAIGKALLGRPVSAETRSKISVRHKGRSHSEESKKNMSEAHIGKRPPDEVRSKMSEAQRQRWAKRKEAQNANCD